MRLLERYLNEKYSLQKYEGKLRDLIVGDTDQLNKIAVIVSLYLYKVGVFCVQRPIVLDDVNITLNYVIYNLDVEDSEIISAANRVLDYQIKIGPDDAEGYAEGDNIVVFIPVSLIEDAPFTSMSLNESIPDKLYSKISKKYLKSNDYVIKTNSQSVINTSSFKSSHQNAIDAFLEEIPNKSSKQTLSIRVTSILQSVKHELTHVMDGVAGFKKLNRFSSLPMDLSRMNSSDRTDMIDALDLLYSLWSYTEFSAFTQTYGKQTSNKRSTKGLINPQSIEKVSSKVIGRPIGVKETQNLNEYIDELQNKIAAISSNDSDNFWSTLRDIVISGSYEQSHINRLSNMSVDKFKKYFISTTIKLINKFKDKTIKNVASQNVYENDVDKIALAIKSACENIRGGGNAMSLNIRLNYYFKDMDQSYPVRLGFNTKDIDNREDSTILNNTNIIINIPALKMSVNQPIKSLLGKEASSYIELYRELKRTSGARKTVLDKLYYDLADIIKVYLDENV